MKNKRTPDFEKLPAEREAEEYFRKLEEEHRAFMNPDEWGIDMRPVFRKYIDPPAELAKLCDSEVEFYLTRMVALLAEYHFCLVRTNHLDDRQLYRHILEKVLPKPIGVGPHPEGGLVYHECCPSDDFDTWLTYYATDEERCEWRNDMDEVPPEKCPLVSDRDAWLDILAEVFRDQPLPDPVKPTNP
jgi:hypothetical protein